MGQSEMGFEQIVIEDQRLAILQVLQQDQDYSHNEHVLSRVLEQLGHAMSGDKLRTELAWLSEQNLIHVESIGDLMVAKLTRRGEDVALGRARIPGVARPRPDF